MNKGKKLLKATPKMAKDTKVMVSIFFQLSKNNKDRLKEFVENKQQHQLLRISVSFQGAVDDVISLLFIQQ